MIAEPFVALVHDLACIGVDHFFRVVVFFAISAVHSCYQLLTVAPPFFGDFKTDERLSFPASTTLPYDSRNYLHRRFERLVEGPRRAPWTLADITVSAASALKRLAAIVASVLMRNQFFDWTHVNWIPLSSIAQRSFADHDGRHHQIPAHKCERSGVTGVHALISLETWIVGRDAD